MAGDILGANWLWYLVARYVGVSNLAWAPNAMVAVELVRRGGENA